MKTLKILVPALLLLGMAPFAMASEITGTLSSGSSVTGTIIGIPIADPAAGNYGAAISVTLTSSGASSIRYTVDGTDPSCAGAGLLYTGPISITTSLTIHAISCYASGASSTVGIYPYIISGGTIGGTVATSSGGTLSGTVTSSPGGTLTGTVTGGGTTGSGGGGGGGGGGGNGPIVGSGGGSGSLPVITPTGGGTVLGETTGVPNLPNTGVGGEWLISMLALLAGLLLLGASAVEIRRLI